MYNEDGARTTYWSRYTLLHLLFLIKCPQTNLTFREQFKALISFPRRHKGSKKRQSIVAGLHVFSHIHDNSKVEILDRDKNGPIAHGIMKNRHRLGLGFNAELTSSELLRTACSVDPVVILVYCRRQGLILQSVLSKLHATVMVLQMEG